MGKVPIGFATKLSLAIVLLVIVSLGIMSFLAVVASQRSLRDEILSANLTTATLAAKALEQYVADAASIMLEAPGRPKLSREIRSANWPEARKVLENFHRNFTQFDYVFVQDPQGVIRVRVPHAETVGQDFSFRDFFREVIRTRRLYISGVYVSKAAQRPVVSIAVPVLDRGDNIKGVLVGALSLNTMSRFVSTIGQDDRSLVYVVDAKGLLIARSAGARVEPLADMKALPIVQAVLAGRTGTTEFSDPGSNAKSLGAYVPISRLGWGVVVTKPVAVAYAATNRLGRWLLWIALGCTAAAVLLGWGLARTLTGPLLRVADATEKLGAGDFSVRVSPESRDEVARLATSFNNMAEQIQKSYRDLAHKTEEAERLSRQNQLVLHAAGEGIYGVDRRGRAIFVNPATAEMLGYEAEDLIGQATHAVFHHSKPDGTPYPEEECPIHAAFKDGTVHHVDDEVFWRKDGTSFPVEYVSTPIRERGDLVGAVVTFKDITARKRGEQALRKSEARNKAILESALDCIITMDHEGRIIEFNPAAEKTFGYARAEVTGREMAEVIIPPSLRERHRRGLARYLTTGEGPVLGKRIELTAMRKDAAEFPAEVAITRIALEGPPMFTGYVRDITERKQMEAALRQSEKLAAMGSLLAGVAHELNNPLGVVLGQAAILQHTVGSGPLAERAEEIARAAKRCARIVQNFLALARQRPIERQQVALNQVIEEAVELIAYQLRVNDIAVRLDLDPELPVLWADPHQLHQVVVNLLANAQQAMQQIPAPRCVTLTTRSDRTLGRVRLEVADTGPGIPPEIQARIFEPFFTTKPAGKGTGLGLSLCHGIIGSHGGSIRVESPPGQGAVFVIELPVEAPPEAVPEARPAEALAPIRGMAILVVDDEVALARTIADMLALDGHQVETATNGLEALVKLGERGYDLILSDLKMPELDGPGLYREVARRYPALCRRFIFLTGDTLGPETEAFLEQTRAPSLTKPFELEDVRRVVQRALREA